MILAVIYRTSGLSRFALILAVYPYHPGYIPLKAGQHKHIRPKYIKHPCKTSSQKVYNMHEIICIYHFASAGVNPYLQTGCLNLESF